MSILNSSDSHAFQSYLNQVDYAESEPVAPEWSMYSSPEMIQDDLDPTHIHKREALARATKDLMALDAGRWQSQSGHSANSYDSPHGQQGGYDAYHHSPLEQHHGTPNLDYDYQYQHQQIQPSPTPYTHSRHDMFPFLNKPQQMRYQHDQVLPPISVNVNGTYPSSSSPSRASATPPISASSSHSYHIATPTLPAPNNTPFLPMNVGTNGLLVQQPQRHIPSPSGSQPNSLRASPALPPSLSNISKRSTYDDLPILPPSTKRQRLSPVSAGGHPYPVQRSRSYPIPGSIAQYPTASSHHYLPNGHIDVGGHMQSGISAARISSTRLVPSRAASVSSNGSSRPGSSHAPLHPNPSGSSKPALLSPSQKKANHIQSEQKRRANIRRGYEALCQTVPALREAIREEDTTKTGKGSINGDDVDMDEEKGPRRSSRPKRVRGKGANGKEESSDKVDGRAGPRSENVVLSKTIDYINELLAERSALLERFTTARSALPTGHPALTPLCQNTCVFKEKKPKNNDLAASSYPTRACDENSAMIAINDVTSELSKVREGAIIKDGVMMIPLWEREWRGGEDDEEDKDEDGAEGDGDEEEESA